MQNFRIYQQFHKFNEEKQEIKLVTTIVASVTERVKMYIQEYFVLLKLIASLIIHKNTFFLMINNFINLRSLYLVEIFLNIGPNNLCLKIKKSNSIF